VKFTELFV